MSTSAMSTSALALVMDRTTPNNAWLLPPLLPGLA